MSLRIIDEFVTILSFRENIDGVIKAKAALWEYADVVGNVGRKMALSGAGATAANIGNLAMFAGLETNYARISALVGIPAEALEAVSGDITRMATNIGMAQATLAEAMYFATSAGIELTESLEVVEMAAKGSKVGLGDVNTIVDLTTSAMNAYASSNLTATEAMDTLTTAIRLGKLEPDELAGVMGRVLPIASALGVSFNEVAGMMAAMSRTGTDADQAATQLRVIMGQLLKPSERAKTALASVGMSIETLTRDARDHGLFAALEKLWHAFDGDEQRIAMVFDEMNALTGIFDLFGDQLDTVRVLLEEQTNAAGSLDRAYAIMRDTIGFKFAKLWNNLEEITTGLGKAMAPMAKLIMDIVTPAIKALARATNSTNPILQTFMRIMGAFGFLSLISGAILMIAGAFAKLSMLLMIWRWLVSPFWSAMMPDVDADKRWVRFLRMRRTLGASRFGAMFGSMRSWKAFGGMFQRVAVYLASLGVLWPLVTYHVFKFTIQVGQMIRMMMRLTGVMLIVDALKWSLRGLSTAMASSRVIAVASIAGGFRLLGRTAVGTGLALYWFVGVLGALASAFGLKAVGIFLLNIGLRFLLQILLQVLIRIGLFIAAVAGVALGILAIIALFATAGFLVDRFWSSITRFIGNLPPQFKMALLPVMILLWALRLLWWLVVIIAKALWWVAKLLAWPFVQVYKAITAATGALQAFYRMIKPIGDLVGAVLDKFLFGPLGFGKKRQVQVPAPQEGGATEYARGGIVPGRRWQAQPALLHGGEAVLPASLTAALMQRGAPGAGDTNIAVTFSEGSIVVHDASDAQVIARGIVSNIEHEIRNLGYAFDSGIDT